MAPTRKLLAAVVTGIVSFSVIGCADRLTPPTPTTYANIDVMGKWAREHADPYGIPSRQLQAYAYAAYAVEQSSGCPLGWPTLAALGAVLTDHGRINGTAIDSAGNTTQPLRGIAPAAEGKDSVLDTDAGQFDGDPAKDVPMGPMQLMPSRWEQYARAVENDATPNPDNIDDAALTTAIIVCSTGDVTSPDGWTAAMAKFNPDLEFLKAVHAKAQEYSR